MWTKTEIEDLNQTFKDIELEDIVDEDELAVIKENSTRYFNLKNGILVPRHNKSVILFSNFRPYLYYRRKLFCSSR